MVETIYGCKWSLTVYRLLANGINRPGEMVRSVSLANASSHSEGCLWFRRPPRLSSSHV